MHIGLMDVWGQFATHSKWCTVALITSSAFALGLGSAAAYWKRRGQHPPEEKIQQVPQNIYAPLINNGILIIKALKKSLFFL